MRSLISLALLAAAAPAASALDGTGLVQGSLHHRGTSSLDYAMSLDSSMAMEIGGESYDITKYGEPLELTVHPSFGDDLPIIVRSGIKLHVIMRSVCHKLGLDISTTSFTKDSRPLDPRSTVGAFGLVAGDILEVSTPELKEREQQEGVKFSRKVSRERHAEEADQVRDAREAARAEKRRKVAMKVAQVAAENKRKHQQELHDQISLKFISPTGQGDVSIGVKRGNWLEGYLELVAKRMGMVRDKTLFLFEDDEGNLARIEPHDSVMTLGLRDEERIVVKAIRD